MIKIKEIKDDKLILTTDMGVSMANAIRRSVNYIPVLAIDTLEISKNDSALYDEIIAHRMGLVPLKNENLKMPEDCDCGNEDGCGKCAIKLKLQAVGPGTVYSSELIPKDNNIFKMPITILDKDQEIEFVANAKMGLGVQHAKFSPGEIYYRYTEDLEKENDEDFNKMIEDSKKKEDKEITLFIESWGQMKAKDIFVKAIDALQRELKDFSKQLK